MSVSTILSFIVLLTFILKTYMCLTKAHDPGISESTYGCNYPWNKMHVLIFQIHRSPLLLHSLSWFH